MRPLNTILAASLLPLSLHANPATAQTVSAPGLSRESIQLQQQIRTLQNIVQSMRNSMQVQVNTLQESINSSQSCNDIGRMYDPDNASADANGCVIAYSGLPSCTGEKEALQWTGSAYKCTELKDEKGGGGGGGRCGYRTSDGRCFDSWNDHQGYRERMNRGK